MSRLARVVIPGLPHHVTHRGNRRADIFLHPADRTAYLGFLAGCAAKADLKIWAYCLMTNHVHLIAVPGNETSLARGVGLADRAYALWINERKQWSGHLWSERFFSTPLDEAHHCEAVRYVERNPVRAALIQRAEQYGWSSARAHCAMAQDPLLDPARPYGLWPIEDWSAWLAEREDGARLQAIRRCTATGRPCGDKPFIERLQDQLGRILQPQKRGPKPKTCQEGADLQLEEMFS